MLGTFTQELHQIVYVRFRPIAVIAGVSETGPVRPLVLLFMLLGAGCSQRATAPPSDDSKRVRLDWASQDSRCSQDVSSGLRPGMFDHGVVSTPKVAKDVAANYFRAMFAGMDTPVEAVLQRPLQAKLQNGVWHVETTLPEGAIGIGFIAEICQSNGRVVALTGYQ